MLGIMKARFIIVPLAVTVLGFAAYGAVSAEQINSTADDQPTTVIVQPAVDPVPAPDPQPVVQTDDTATQPVDTPDPTPPATTPSQPDADALAAQAEADEIANTPTSASNDGQGSVFVLGGVTN